MYHHHQSSRFTLYNDQLPTIFSVSIRIEFRESVDTAVRIFSAARSGFLSLSFRLPPPLSFLSFRPPPSLSSRPLLALFSIHLLLLLLFSLVHFYYLLVMVFFPFVLPFQHSFHADLQVFVFFEESYQCLGNIILLSYFLEFFHHLSVIAHISCEASYFLDVLREFPVPWFR